MVEFPSAGIYSIGFITNEQNGEVQQKTKEKVVCVFVPTTPNPTSGFLILVPEEKVVKLDDFNSFLEYFQKKYVSSWTRANTGFVCIPLQSSLNQNNRVWNCSPKQIGPNSRRSEGNINTTG